MACFLYIWISDDGRSAEDTGDNFLFQKFCDRDFQIVIDIGSYRLIKVVLSGAFLFFKIINRNSLSHRIDDPVFPNTGGAVFQELFQIIHPLTGRRYDLNNFFKQCQSY